MFDKERRIYITRAERIEKEEKECYISRMSDYIADTIAINYRHHGNNHKYSFNIFFNQAFCTFNYNEEQLQQFYDLIEDSLQQNYGLIRINKGFDKPLVLKDLNKEE